MTACTIAFRALAPVMLAAILINMAGCKPMQESANQTAGTNQSSPADREAIERLHQRDMEASKKWDVEALVSLWTDDIVSISSFGDAVIGKEQNRAQLLKMKEESRDVEIVDYKLDFKEVTILGGWAYEWGTFSGAVRPAGGGELIQSTGKVMRVLKRDGDGNWKVARTMFSADTAGDEQSPAPQ